MSRYLPLALLLVGCTRHPAPPLAISRLAVAEESLAAAPALGLGADQMRTSVETAVKHQGALLLKADQPPPSGTPAYRVRAEIGAARLEDVPYDDGGVGQEAQVELVLEATRSTSDGTVKLTGAGTGRVPAPPPPDVDGQAAAFKQAFGQGLELAAARLAHAALARERSTDALRADLGSPDGGVREAAADVLVDRHDAAAIPVLVGELDSADEGVKLKAIGELVELRAKDAVPKLIDLAQSRDPRGTDPRFQMQIIYALGSIGGSEAEAYLYTIASGHPDEMVRNAAREASAELQRDHRPKPSANNKDTP